MYSNRFNKNIETDDFYRFSKLSKEKEKVRKMSNEKILDLGIGDPSSLAPLNVREEIKESIDNDNYQGYSDNGIIEFRYKVSNFIGVSYKNVTHTMGTKSALCLLGFLYLDKGDYVITTSPGYGVLPNIARWLKAKVYNLDLKEENNYDIDFKSIPKSILKRTKLMYLNYPNNPTGKIASKELYLEALRLAKKYNFMVINDNAYGDLIFDKSEYVNFKDVEGFFDNGIELYSFSKGYNMTGYRIGYILSNERVIKAFQNIKDNFDSGQFIPIQLGAMKALDNFKFLDNNKNKYLNRQIRLHEILTKYGFKYNLPKAGFFAYCKIPNKVDDIKMNNAYKFSMYLLKKYKIMTIPYENYNSVRFSLTFKEDDNFFFKELDDRLSKIKFEFDWSE